MGKRRPQKPASCLWCDRPGASNEDVVPKWVATRYPAEGWWNHEYAHPEHGDFKFKRAKRPRAISRKFCEECNNGWMSRLEQRAKPILTEMMEGRPIGLDADDQELVAFWICKTALAFDSMEPAERRLLPLSFYSSLYRAQRPLELCQVWLGRRADSPSVAWHRAHVLSRPGRDDGGFGSTLALGQMVAHVIWHPEGAGQIKLAPHLAGALIQMWPLRRESRRWPPFRLLGDGEDLSWVAKGVVFDAQVLTA